MDEELFEFEATEKGLRLTRYIGPEDKRELIVPGIVNGRNVCEIGIYAFYKCENLRQVILSEGIESVGTGAFALCKNLRMIGFPDSLKQIGQGAFFGCESEKILAPDELDLSVSHLCPECGGGTDLTGVCPACGFGSDEYDLKQHLTERREEEERRLKEKRQQEEEARRQEKEKRRKAEEERRREEEARRQEEEARRKEEEEARRQEEEARRKEEEARKKEKEARLKKERQEKTVQLLEEERKSTMKSAGGYGLGFLACVIITIWLFFPYGGLSSIGTAGEFVFLMIILLVADIGLFIPTRSYFKKLSLLNKDLEAAKVDVEKYENQVRERKKQWEEAKKREEEQKAEIKKRQQEQYDREHPHPRCPMCGSYHTYRITQGDRVNSAFWNGIASEYIGYQYECLDCKHKW